MKILLAGAAPGAQQPLTLARAARTALGSHIECDFITLSPHAYDLPGINRAPVSEELALEGRSGAESPARGAADAARRGARLPAGDAQREVRVLAALITAVEAHTPVGLELPLLAADLTDPLATYYQGENPHPPALSLGEVAALPALLEAAIQEHPDLLARLARAARQRRSPIYTPTHAALTGPGGLAARVARHDPARAQEFQSAWLRLLGRAATLAPPVLPLAEGKNAAPRGPSRDARLAGSPGTASSWGLGALLAVLRAPLVPVERVLFAQEPLSLGLDAGGAANFSGPCASGGGAVEASSDEASSGEAGSDYDHVLAWCRSLHSWTLVDSPLAALIEICSRRAWPLTVITRENTCSNRELRAKGIESAHLSALEPVALAATVRKIFPFWAL